MSSGVFKNKESLSPDFPIERHWDSIPHRTDQIKVLWNFYGDILEKRGEAYLRRLQIIGPAGSGKTCTLKFFGKQFEKEAKKMGVNLDHIYMNLKFEGGRRVVFYRTLVGKIEPNLVSVSFSAEEQLRSLINYLQEKKRFVLLTIDEIDYFVKHFKTESIVYDLTRLNELSEQPCGVVGVTFLAREREFHRHLNPAELSTLGRIFVEFKPYTQNQIYDILEKRSGEAFIRGACSSETVSFIAGITASRKINGDLRYALDLLLYSGILADNQGSERVLPEHVRRVLSQISPSLTTEDILGISDKGKIVLLAIVRSLNKKKPYTSLREIRENVNLICEEFGFPFVKTVEERIQDLWDRDIIDFRSLLEIGISGAPIEDLDRFLDSLVERLRTDIKHEN